MRNGNEDEAVEWLVRGGLLPVTRRRESDAWQAVMARPEARRDPVYAALKVLAHALRQGYRGSTVAGLARTLQHAAYRRGVVGFAEDPRWAGAKRTLARAIGAGKAPVETPDWDVLMQRFRRLRNPAYRAAAALMLSTGLRYRTVREARASAVVDTPQGVEFTARFDKCMPLDVPRRFAIVEPCFVDALRHYTLDPQTATGLERAYPDHRCMPRLLALPKSWPATRTGLSATAIRRAVERELLRSGADPQQVAHFVGHTLRAQEGHYRVEVAPNDRRFALALCARAE